MGSTRVKTPSVFGGAGFFPSTVCKSLVFLFSGLAAQSLHVRMFACMAVCMYVRMYVCMYVSTYVLTLGYFYVEIFSGFFTAFAGQSQFIDIDGDM